MFPELANLPPNTHQVFTFSHTFLRKAALQEALGRQRDRGWDTSGSQRFVQPELAQKQDGVLRGQVNDFGAKRPLLT
jgi:hypothetical protein